MKVEVTSKNVQKLQLATKVDDEGDLTVKVSVESKLHPGDIARLLNLQKNGAPLFFSIGSQQAQLDLGFFNIQSEKIEKVEEAPGLVECPDCRGGGTTLDEETRIDVACSTCRGTGLVPVVTNIAETATVDAPESLEATTPVAQVEPDKNGNKPKGRGLKLRQGSVAKI